MAPVIIGALLLNESPSDYAGRNGWGAGIDVLREERSYSGRLIVETESAICVGSRIRLRY